MHGSARTFLLALALTPLACGGDLAAAEDEPEFEPIPCESSLDCPLGYSCSNGECRPDPKPPLPCDSHHDCAPGTYCLGGDCVDADPIGECAEALVAWSELDTRTTFGPGVEALFVHDFDHDGRDELVARTPKELRIHANGEARRLTVFPSPAVASGEQLFVDLDGDGRLDLLARSSLDSTASWIALGLDGVELGPWQPGPSLVIDELAALDWTPHGAGELAGRFDGGSYRVGLLSDVLAPRPTLELFGKGTGPVRYLRGADFDGEPGDELIYGNSCAYTMRTRAGWYAHLDPLGWDSDCAFDLGDLDDDGDRELVDVEYGLGVSLVRVSEGGVPDIDDSGRAQLETVRFNLPDRHEGLRVLRPVAGGPAMVWLFHAQRPKLARDLGPGVRCYELAPPIVADPDDPRPVRAYGDFDGDGADEVALVDPEGRLRVLDGR